MPFEGIASALFRETGIVTPAHGTSRLCGPLLAEAYSMNLLIGRGMMSALRERKFAKQQHNLGRNYLPAEP